MQIILLIAWQRDSWMFNRLAVKSPSGRDLEADRDPVAYRDPAMVETEVQLLFGQLPTAQPDWMFWDTRRQGREA